MTKQTRIRLAITSVLSLSGAAFASSAIAADDNSDKEQCAGIIKAGKNDCATATNACHGHVESRRQSERLDLRAEGHLRAPRRRPRRARRRSHSQAVTH